ncbi:Antitoxin MazE [Campylobacter hyointestinalis subsp. hyointestinalis]|uniref:Antitoxin MazE n=1 Tax=Campylobacter hyointestinalis subsp. hyointestinalis TaxID=91352 RepID=A0A9W5AV29_CAMHY|nr:AbrB/MazE/SpoVT family DNA-binding domain-containing protein [Campylobacter hyointestinalis]CUU88658.1 Antitoxin MazE [Campylobacter hyointestinalis subsp. hyointestinalis]CUU91385.1 Antitoxin MazE [Campylobacter hyointestinalis subsp. hyointestinalis]CUU91487.1 Antitoxin MazE [Campylobacter hyointestinalis subsp. hyointestinalis]
MQVALNKWGNSIGIRVPNNILRELNIGLGRKIDIRVENGRAIIEPIDDKNEKLLNLLNSITEDNLHSEICCGNTIGKENI